MIAHLINTDVGSRGVLGLYLNYRRRNFDFLHNSAKMLLDNHRRVLVVTGFPIPPAMVPETDGPPGALAIGKAVEKLGGKADILTYPEVRNALGEFWESFVERPRVSKYSLVITVETPGRASDGRYYSMRGIPIERGTFDETVLEAHAIGVPTIGIGDGGNEAGMGKIRNLIVKHVPLGERIASVVETDELILSAVSNWGAYGLVAEASRLAGEDLFGDFDEWEVVKALADEGIIDGVLGRGNLSVDGVPLKIHKRMIDLIKALVLNQLRG